MFLRTGAAANAATKYAHRTPTRSTGTADSRHPVHECTLLMKRTRAFSLAACGEPPQVFNQRGFARSPCASGRKTCAAVLFTGEARELRNGEARSPHPCSAATADVVCVGTNMCVAAFLPPLECSSRREQPVAHCRLSAHLPVRLALVRAVSRTSHSVSHGVGHGVTHSVTHSVTHGVSHGFSTAVAADVRAGGAACVHHLCHDSHATPVTTCADRPPP